MLKTNKLSRKLSVAMTTYKSNPDFLVKQLISLRDQILRPDEVIIVDDGSGDGTIDLLKKFINDYNLLSWHVIDNKVNMGYIEAFKEAIFQTTGEYIFLCDHDDIWLPEKIRVLSDYLDKNEWILMLGSSTDLIDAGDNTIGKLKESSIFSNPKNCITTISFKMVIARNRFQGCRSVIRRELVRPFIDSFSKILPHDYQLCIIASIENKLAYYNESLMKYRIHNNNEIGLGKSEPDIENRLVRLKMQVKLDEELIRVVSSQSDDLHFKAILHDNLTFSKSRLTAIQERKISTCFVALYYCIKIKKTDRIKSCMFDIIIITKYKMINSKWISIFKK